MQKMNKLHGLIVENGYTLKSFARAINMPYPTFLWKMKNCKFGTDDIKVIMKALSIENPVPYFFA